MSVPVMINIEHASPRMMVGLRAIITAGMPGSGKEEFLLSIKPLGLPFVRMGDAVRHHKATQGSKLSTGEYAQKEREIHGDDIWAIRTLELLGDGVTVIDGCRSDAEVAAFKRELGDGLKVFAIHSDPETRYRRLVSRAREDAPLDRDDFNVRDGREMSWGLAKVIALADVMIVNDRGLEDFHRLCLKAVKEVIDR